MTTEPTGAGRPGITGRTAVVTGATRGIGAGVARALAQAGATVVVSGRDEDALAAVVAGVREAGATAHGVVADVTDPQSVARLREEAERLAGPVDLVAAVAGGLGEPVQLVDMTVEQWHATIDANLTSAFLTLRAFLPGMIERRRGSCLTVSSTGGRLASPASPAYGSAKAGLLMLTRQAALQVAPAGVRVNALAPGATLNDRMQSVMSQEARDQLASMHPLGRLGTPEDMASAAVFLLSDDASWITGACLDVNGGRVMV